MPGAWQAFLFTSDGIKQNNKSCPDILPHYRPSDFFPSSRHIVPRTTNFNTPVVSVKQPLFHLVLSEYPRALSCSISKCRSCLSTSFSLSSIELYTPVSVFPLSLSHSLSLSFTSRAISPLFFPYSIA